VGLLLRNAADAESNRIVPYRSTDIFISSGVYMRRSIVWFLSAAADAEKKNPEGLAEAKRLYKCHCAMCHGDEGDGKGDLAVEMKLGLKDWRDPDSLAK
jgi:hypothetical protein